MKGSELGCVPPNIDDSFSKLQFLQRYYSNKGKLPQEHPLAGLSQSNIVRIQLGIKGEFYAKPLILSLTKGRFVDIKQKISGSGKKLLSCGLDVALIISRRNPFHYNSLNRM